MATDKARVAELQLRHRQRNFERMLHYLDSHPCVDCGEVDPIVLEFDHLPEFEKRFEIGRAVTGSTRSWAAILAEIAKCDVVCANCHRRRGSRRGGFRKHLASVGFEPRISELDARPRNAVEHGGGARGKGGCTCEPCRKKRSEYEKARRASRASGLVPPAGFEPATSALEGPRSIH